MRVNLVRGSEWDGVSGAHPHKKGFFFQDHVRLDGVERPSPGPQWSLYPCSRLSSAGARLAVEPPCLGSQEELSAGGPVCMRHGHACPGAASLCVRCASFPTEWQVIAACQSKAGDEGRDASGLAPVFLLLLHTCWWHPLCRLRR